MINLAVRDDRASLCREHGEGELRLTWKFRVEGRGLVPRVLERGGLRFILKVREVTGREVGELGLVLMLREEEQLGLMLTFTAREGLGLVEQGKRYD